MGHSLATHNRHFPTLDHVVDAGQERVSLWARTSRQWADYAPLFETLCIVTGLGLSFLSKRNERRPSMLVALENFGRPSMAGKSRCPDRSCCPSVRRY
jgi:hypothetical protein